MFSNGTLSTPVRNILPPSVELKCKLLRQTFAQLAACLHSKMEAIQSSKTSVDL
jgi:hypothetical protein